MAMFDNGMFDPQSFGGLGGWLQQALQQGWLPTGNMPGQGFPPAQPQAQAQGMQSGIGEGQPQMLPPNAQPAGPAGSVNPPTENGGLLSGLLSGLGLAPSPASAAPAGPQQVLGPQGSPDIFSRLSAAAHNMSNGGIPGLFDAAQGLATGQRLDKPGIQQQALQATYQALIKSGVPPAIAQAAALNPEILKTVAGNYFDTKPQFGIIGQDQMGRNIYGFIRPNQQQVTPAQLNGVPNAATNANAANMDLHGEEYLKTLPPQMQQQVKMIAEGRAPYPSGFLLKTPYGQFLTQAISQYDPSMTAQDYSTKLATMKAFDVGAEAKALKAANQTILHAQSLLPLIDQLGNSNVVPGVTNRIIAAKGANFDPQYQNTRAKFENTVTALASELTKAFRGNAGAVSDIEHWRQNMSATASPETLKGGVQAAMKLLEGAITSLGEQYNKGTRSNKDALELLDPKNRAAMESIIASGNKTTAMPGPAEIEAEMRRRGLK